MTAEPTYDRTKRRMVIPRNRAEYFDREAVMARRLDLGLTRTEVAYFSGTSETVYARQERGDAWPSNNLGGRIYRALGLPIDPDAEVRPPLAAIPVALAAETAAKTAAEAAQRAAEAAQTAAEAAAQAATQAAALTAEVIE